MKSFKILPFSIDFSTSFLTFSLASGGSAPLTPYKSIFPKFSLNFRENFDKILKNFQKIAKFTCKFSKNYKIFIDFLTFFGNFRVWKNAKFLISPMKKVPPPKLPGPPPPNAKSCITYWLPFLIFLQKCLKRRPTYQ